MNIPAYSWKFWTLFAVIGLLQPLASFAKERKLVAAEINPAHIRLGVYHSYQYKRLLISLVTSDPLEFDCQPNRYILYHYGAEDYHEIEAGNLKISSDYQHIFRTKIHALGGLTEQNRNDWKRHIETLMNLLNVSAETMKKGKMKSLKNTTICWQQPELLDMNLNSVQQYPLLAANLCHQLWCSELYWTAPESVQFWVQQIPQEYQLIQLNTKTGTYTYLKRGPVFSYPQMSQANAPRDNLITEQNINEGKLVLYSQKNQNTVFLWQKQNNGKIAVALTRDFSNSTAASRHLPRIHQMIAKRQIPEALQLIRFALWLEPTQVDLKLERLKAFASLLALENLYESLANDFSPTDRFTACQRLHLDQAFQKLWQKEDFIRKFKEICS